MSRFQSAVGKTVQVIDGDARLRRADLRTFDVWSAPTPPGVTVGAVKVLPKGSRVEVQEVVEGPRSQAFARVSSAAGLAGWTSASNLAGGLAGETLGLFPDAWDAEPDGRCFTVTDPQALLREGAPAYKAKGSRVAQGATVVVVSTSPGGAYVEVARGSVGPAGPVVGARLGWTARSNLAPGWSRSLVSPTWFAPDGPNACWQGGKYLGPSVLVRIVGSGNEVEYVTLDALDPLVALLAAARAAGHDLAVNSGFRTWGEQAALYDGYKAKKPGFNKAAPPGSSNHQNGRAVDLSTGGFDTPVYGWMAVNGPALGFIRTVSGEHWHWEYLPEEAAVLARSGKWVRRGVSP